MCLGLRVGHYEANCKQKIYKDILFPRNSLTKKRTLY